MIILKQLSKQVSLGGQVLHILHPLDLTIPRGQFVAVMGPSGSGKSTLLGLLAGLDRPSGGQVWINGEELTAMNEDELARFRGRSVGFVFQSFQLIPTLTALENVQVPLEIQGQRHAAERARVLLGQVGLLGRAAHYPAQLSGGEQQRVAIARAFACQPAVLLADEPTGNLDSAAGQQVLELLVGMQREHGTTVVLVTHDAQIARAAERIVRLKDGHMVEDVPGPARAALAGRGNDLAGPAEAGLEPPRVLAKAGART
ncbi:MAG TPA: ABC transporter ATP-binding protein [bacterium]|nr:ABC transporter ATP-binding protein [bacterium]